MAEKKFSELTTAAILGNDDIFVLSQIDSGSLTSKKTTLTAIANHINTVVQYTNAYGTQAKTTAGAINELKQLISLIPQFSIEVVEELPTEDISDTTIYLVPAEDPEVGNYYEEYIHVNDTWELVGTTAVDLSAYYTKLEVDGLLADKLEADDFEANQTASANPITLETKQAGLAKSCVVEMKPIQDLHGQSAPYPAGGGKNKYSVLVGNDDWTGYNGGTSSGTDGVLSVTSTSTNNSGVYASNTNKLYIYAGSNTGVYTLSAYVKSNANATLRMGFTGLSSQDFSITTAWQRISITVTLDGSAHSITFYSRGDAVTYDIKDMQFERGETATSYAPYSNICPISGRTEASVTRTAGEDVETHTHQYGQTVYGGVDDFVNGGATETIGSIVLDGSETWDNFSAQNGFYMNLAAMKSGRNTESLSEWLPTVSSVTDFGLQFGANNSVLYACHITDNMPEITDLASWKSYLSTHNLRITFPLATPTTIQLSPEAVTLLKGLNVISTDGDKVQVEFSDIPVGDYSVLLDYIKSLEARIQTLEG